MSAPRYAIWVSCVAGLSGTRRATLVLKFGKIVGKQHMIDRFSA